MFTRTFDAYVTDTFKTAREDLTEAMRKIVAEQSLTSLESGQTVKRFGKALGEIGLAAVDDCRHQAGRSIKRRARLAVVLPQEVDGLVALVKARVQALGLVDTAVFDRFSQARERILSDRSPPKKEKTPAWKSAWAVFKPHIPAAILTTLGAIIAGVAIAFFIVLFGIPAARDQETRKAADAAVVDRKPKEST